MTKAEIVTEIVNRTGFEKGTVVNCVESFMEVIKETVADGEKVYLRGFGSFGVKKRAAKLARNISKGENILIEAHNVPAFKPYPEFKEMVR